MPVCCACCAGEGLWGLQMAQATCDLAFAVPQGRPHTDTHAARLGLGSSIITRQRRCSLEGPATQSLQNQPHP